MRPSSTVDIEIPQLNVAEYHRPYVAIWLEGADQKVAANLSVWYQTKDTKEGHGTKWLPDLRQWWRKSGRTLKVPVDGVTGPTRPVGKHALKFDRQAARPGEARAGQLHARGRSRARSRRTRTGQDSLHLAGQSAAGRQGAGQQRDSAP